MIINEIKQTFTSLLFALVDSLSVYVKTEDISIETKRRGLYTSIVQTNSPSLF